MPFFNRSGTKRKLNGVKPSGTRLDRKPKNKRSDEVISSESEDETEPKRKVDEESGSDEETSAEKRLRLAKIYLADVQAKEAEKAEVADFNKDIIAKRLKQDLLEQAGRLHKRIAEQVLVDTDKPHKLLRRHQFPVTCLCLSVDSRYVFSSAKDGVIIQTDLQTGSKVDKIPANFKGKPTTNGHSGTVFALAVSPDGQYLCSGGSDKVINVWDARSLAHVKQLAGHKDTISGLSFREGSLQLYSSSHDRSVKIWNLQEMGYVETLFGHQDAILDIDSLTKERVLTCGGRDRSLRLWKIVEESQLVFNAHSNCGSVDCVRMINEEHFVSGSDDGALSIWSMMKKKPVCVIQNAHQINGDSEPCWISALAVYRYSDLVASGSRDGWIKLWKVAEDYKRLTIVQQIPIVGFVNALEFNSTASALVVGVGQEHKSGRWWRCKEGRNSVVVIPLGRKSL